MVGPTRFPLLRAAPTGRQMAAPIIELTERILQASQLVDIQLIDHFILSPEGAFSFAEHSLIQSV